MQFCHAHFQISKTNSATLFTDKPITSRREIENILRMIALDADLFDEPASAIEAGTGETGTGSVHESAGAQHDAQGAQP